MGGILSMGDFSTCSRPTEQARRIERGRYEDALASSTEPRGFGCTCGQVLMTCSRRIGAVTCGWLIKLRSAYILCYFIRNRRFALVVSFVFLNAEYRIALVDLIVALRRTKGRGRRTLRSPPSPSSGLHLIHPGNPLRRGITAAAGLGQFRNPVSGAIVTRQFRIWFGALCSGWYRSRFSRVVGLVSFVFHYWGIGRSCLRLRVVWLWLFVGFALTAIGSFVLFGTVWDGLYR